MSQDLLKEVKKGNAEKVKQMLSSVRSHFDINFIDSKTKMGFLHLAIQNYDLETLSVLLKAGSDNNPLNLNLQDGNEMTPLALACSLGYSEGVELILKQKDIDVNYQLNYNDNRQAIHVACQNKNNLEVMNLLAKRGANLNAVSHQLDTPLSIAIHEGDSEKAIWLIHHPKVNIFAKDNQENTCLHLAIIAGLGDFVKEFFSMLEDNSSARSKMIPSQEEVAVFLNTRNKAGNSILHQSVLSNRIGIMKLLKTIGVSLGLNADLPNKQNQTAEQLINHKEDKKRQEDSQLIQRKNEIKVEKAIVKEEKRRKEQEEKTLQQQLEKEEEKNIELQQETHQSNKRRTLIIFFFILFMMTLGVILFFEAKKNMSTVQVKPSRTDYDDFL